MNTKKLIAVVFVGFLSTGLASAAIPNDVSAFIKNAERCEHSAGEWDSSLSDKRQREIERAVVRYCQPAQQQLKQLRRKYRNDPEVKKTIRRHAYESVTSFR